ncbi:hypothetical protein ACFPZ0_21170 [Streptomonospora nanhaiensis]|uniref:Uncharacterized protein n=1 Tax=Streptomonospora nanhaiensis TaxID=1323731 RepID=A0A853BTE2_9ACTN|nr:hypothetical protein [Streptomonospora nanhaiensis]MBV2362867.1 hypothetical protein [Streptomonospora nanhaiensis]MBX9389388.1 hypothetical protein [Streptomonospora nanhaiensis]NYI97771.1 hypothetical protein [Streptomonospora nanhaiensis]
MDTTPTRECCALTDCPWCGRADLVCRFCAGTGRWSPERPVTDSDGMIVWERITEECRMCVGTGKEHRHTPLG